MITDKQALQFGDFLMSFCSLLVCITEQFRMSEKIVSGICHCPFALSTYFSRTLWTKEAEETEMDIQLPNLFEFKAPKVLSQASAKEVEGKEETNSVKDSMRFAANVDLSLWLYQNFYGSGGSHRLWPQPHSGFFGGNGPKTIFDVAGWMFSIAVAAVCLETDEGDIQLIDTGLVLNQWCLSFCKHLIFLFS